MTLPSNPVVYRIHDKTGSLIYIGSTVDLGARLQGHYSSAPWWLGDLTVSYTEYEAVPSARDAEVYAILTEHPRWNIHWRCEAHPDGHASTLREVAERFPYRETGQFSMSWRRDPKYYRAPHRCPLKNYPADEAGVIPRLPGVRVVVSDPPEKVAS